MSVMNKSKLPAPDVNGGPARGGGRTQPQDGGSSRLTGRLGLCTHAAAGLRSLHRKGSSRTASPSGLLPWFSQSDTFPLLSQQSGLCITNTGESVIWFQAHSESSNFLKALTEATCQAPRWAELQPGVQNRRCTKASAGPTHDGRTEGRGRRCREAYAVSSTEQTAFSSSLKRPQSAPSSS